MNKRSIGRAMVVVVAGSVSVSVGCSSKKDDQGASKAPVATNSPKPPAPATATPKPVRRGGFGCDVIKRMDKDGEITAIEYLAGKDNMGLDVDGGKVALRAGTTMTGSTMRLQMRGSYAEVENNGNKACVAISRLTFSLPRFKPEANKPVPYKLTGKVEDVPRGLIPAVYVDINETKSIVGIGTPTIEYIATEGSFTFTKLNDGGDNNNKHSLAFSLVFQKTEAGKLDPSVKTKLTGSFTFETRRPL